MYKDTNPSPTKKIYSTHLNNTVKKINKIVLKLYHSAFISVAIHNNSGNYKRYKGSSARMIKELCGLPNQEKNQIEEMVLRYLRKFVKLRIL
jgi:Holliday junction resolvasome RuvABC endonuclease subunit